MKTENWWRTLVITVTVIVFAEIFARGGDNPPDRVSLCDVLAHPVAYSDKIVMTTVRITSTKEGASLWSPECPKAGVWLRIDSESRSGPGMPELNHALDQAGLSDHPLVVTLTGVFVRNQYDEIRHRRRSFFKAIAAKDITRSRAVERR